MHLIKNNGIIQRIVCESINKKIGICGVDDSSYALQELLHHLGVEVERFFVWSDKNESTIYENEKAVNIYELMYEDIGTFFIVEPHAGRACIKYKNVLAEMGYVEWQDYVHIFSTAMYEDVIVRSPDCIDINLGVLWSQDRDGFTVFGSDREDAYTIVSLGGSTTYADWLVYAKCWSELLYEKFCNSGRKNIRILCGGAPAFDSTQELIKFLRDVVPMKPNMVLSYSGVNDVVDSHGDINNTGPGYPFAFPKLTEKMKQLVKDTQESKELYLGRKNEQSTADIWMMNKKIMNFVSEEMGIVFYTFLQPMLFYGNYLIDRELNVKIVEYRKKERFRLMFDHAAKFCEKIKFEMRNMDFMVDFTDIFDGCSKLFVDFVHVNEWGNEIIAEKIYQYIEKNVMLNGR